MIEELYQTYFHDVYLYLCSLSKDASLAEELTQETFFRALKSVKNFHGDCDIRVWLCQIAKNLFLTHCKRSDRFTGDEIPETVPDTSITIEDTLTDTEQAMKIHKILHQMENPYKEVFTLRIFGELLFKQISEIFGKSESWARVTFHRAKLRIIDELEELS